MFEQAQLPETRPAFGDWILRGAVALFFVLIGEEKFPSRPGTEWVKMFQEIGLGQWFRYFTGVVEILGGVLVLIPWTAMAGLVLLAVTMASAALILTFVLGRPGDAVFSGGICIALTAFWCNRRETLGRRLGEPRRGVASAFLPRRQASQRRAAGPT